MSGTVHSSGGTAVATNTESATMPTLPRVPLPNGALAVLEQRCERRRSVFPYASTTPQAADTTHYTELVPSEQKSSTWFRAVHEGFRCANFINYVATTAPFNESLHATEVVRRLLRAEKAEFECDTPSENSLPPRKLAAWVHIGSRCLNFTGGQVLDAMAHWACTKVDGVRISNVVRLTVLCAGQTRAFFKQTAHETMYVPSAQEDAFAMRVSVRFCHKGTLHTHTTEFVHTDVSATACLARVQSCLLCVAGLFEQQINPILALQCSAVPKSAFAYHLNHIDAEFALVLESVPSTTITASGTLENTGMLIRLCEIKRGPGGITDNGALHGALLCARGRRADAVAFVQKQLKSARTLSPPLSTTEQLLGLHVCAVQAEAVCLGVRVSLFGTSGEPGKPVHAPGSWVWCESAAIRPFDASLAAVFHAYPCDAESVLPMDTRLVEAYRVHFARAGHIFSSLGTEPKVAADADSTVEMALEAPTQGTETELFTHAAFRLNLGSQRSHLGEMYTQLVATQAPKDICRTILLAMGTLGSGATCDQLFVLLTECLALYAAGVSTDSHVENKRLKRTLDVMMSAVDSPRCASVLSVSVSSAERVRRMLALVKLKRGDSVVLPNAHSRAAERVVVILKTSLGVDNDDGDIRAKRVLPLAELGEMREAVEAIGHSMSLLMHTTSTHKSAFVMVLSVALDMQLFRVDADMQHVSCDVLLGEASPRVVVLHFFEAGKARLSATVRMDT